MEDSIDRDALLTAGDVAARFGVSRNTIDHWVQRKWLPVFRTPGGHRRFRRADVEELWDRAQAHEWSRNDWRGQGRDRASDDS